MTEPEYTHETAAGMKKAIEIKLNNGESFTEVDIQHDIDAWLKIERGIWEIYHPIDNKCHDIPTWQRTPGQIVRNTADTAYYTFDEIGLYRRFTTEAAGWLGWNKITNTWYSWTGDHWTDEGADLLAEKVSNRLRDTLEYEAPALWFADTIKDHGKIKLIIEKPKEFKALQKTASRIYTCTSVARAARTELAAVFDESKDIPFKNGMFNPETGEIKPHKADNYNTTVCNTPLNLNAAPFPPGEQFFNEISCNDKEWTAALFRCLGRCLLYGNPDQKFYVFYGGGQNGKGVLCDWLQAALGNLIGSCLPAEISKLNPDGRQTTLFDNVSRCRVILFKEAGKLEFDDELVKRLTGEKDIPLKRIHTGTKTLPIAATPLFISNNIPTSDRGGKSMMRRQIGFPFDFQTEHPDADLLQKLTTPEGNEWLVCRIVSGLLETLQPGAPGIKEMLPQRVKQFTDELNKEADIVYQWLNECCIRSDDDKQRTDRQTLYTSFCGFAYSSAGLNPTPGKYRMTAKTFGDRLRGHNLKPLEGKQRASNGNTCRFVYPGICLNDTGDEYYSIENTEASRYY